MKSGPVKRRTAKEVLENMPHEARWAILGRALADAAWRREAAGELVQQCANLRRVEQDCSDRMMQFAALARQVGDAIRVGRDIAPLVERLKQLRSAELGRPAQS